MFITALRRKFLNNQNGNVFSMLFGGVALVGVLGAATMQIIQGPMATALQANNIASSETTMMNSAQLIMTISPKQPNKGDCDADNYVEPLKWKAAGGKPSPADATGSDGGGHIPNKAGAGMTDTWGTPLGYCSWDHGTHTGTTDRGCGQSAPTNASGRRLEGHNNDEYIAIALISAGSDRTFQTACKSFSAADSDNDGNLDSASEKLVETPSGSDDIVYTRTYKQAAKGSGGLWRLVTGDSSTATTKRHAAVGTQGADFDSQAAGVFYANNGLIIGEYDTEASGAPECTAGTNDGLIIYSTDIDSVVRCNAGKGKWEKLAGKAGNFPPIYSQGADATLNVPEDSGAHNIAPLLEASDLNTTQTLTWSIKTAPSHGQLNNFPRSKAANIGVTPSGAPELQYEITHADYYGDDMFKVDVSDGIATTTLIVNVNISNVNDAPVASNDSGSMDEDTTKRFDVVANDNDIDGDDLTIDSITSAPSNGSASIVSNEIEYTPDTNYNGSDSLTYRVKDGNGGTDTETLSITVNAVNDAPVASDDGTFTVISHNTSTVDVISNDSDVDGDSLDVAGTTSPSTGTSSHSGDNVTYDPDEGSISGTISDSFDYTASDGSLTDTATVDFTVHHHHDYSQCYSNDRYWYHSGGGREDRRQNCSHCCGSDTCDADGGCCNNSRSNVCSGGDVWKQDQCGNLDYRVSSCSCGCSGGSCDSCCKPSGETCSNNIECCSGYCGYSGPKGTERTCT